MKLSFAGLSGGAMSFDTMKAFEQRECHVVYFFYGANNELLYVGRTINFKLRWSQHMQSDKDMKKIKRVCLHMFETKPETMFYEAQKILECRPLWNKSGLSGKISRNCIEPLEIVWFVCNLEMTAEEFDKIADKMQLYYSDEWFDRHTQEELLNEVNNIHLMSIGAIGRPKHLINPQYDNKGLT